MWKDSVHVIIIEGVQSGRERKGEWEREREQERVRESIPNKGKQSAPLRMVVTVTVIECVSAAGESAPMVFVLSDGPLPDLWELVSDKSFGGYILALIFPFPQPFWTSIALAGLHPAGLIMRFAKSGSSRNSCRLPVRNVLMNQSQFISKSWGHFRCYRTLQEYSRVPEVPWSAPQDLLMLSLSLMVTSHMRIGNCGTKFMPSLIAKLSSSVFPPRQHINFNHWTSLCLVLLDISGDSVVNRVYSYTKARLWDRWYAGMGTNVNK